MTEITRTREDLHKKFTKLGVDDIEFCIEDELDGGNPRLAPLVLFHEIWQGALKKSDTEWVDETIKHFESRRDFEDIASSLWPEDQEFLDALNAVKESGIDIRHITKIVRRSQEHLIQHIAYTLSGCSTDDAEFDDVNWGVFEMDDDYNPVKQMNVLHEYFGLVDPDR